MRFMGSRYVDLFAASREETVCTYSEGINKLDKMALFEDIRLFTAYEFLFYLTSYQDGSTHLLNRHKKEKSANLQKIL